ncbi:MAG: hypothetical protein RLZZ200_506 [Pseudomonadota bacterium]|jgi:hypothetical protein
MLAERTDLPDVVKAAQRMLAEIQLAVRQFPRMHRYDIGARLLDSAEQICVQLLQSWHQRHRRLTVAQAASDELDQLKVRIQLGHDVQAWRSYAQAQHVYRLATEVGQQCGGWLLELRNKGQNAPASRRTQRAPTLSSPVASPAGANL